ncbi:MAG: bifunctional folylpolyglutamate synthase/dihydrofolate synthase [Muribaculaceae bacterium]|nr:bifunctional folylpolyglutamate synthase/dihydrofolate synthase [Muribaculaceae bacterium]
MTYSEATDFLFTQLPVFQSQGPGAYKPGLDTVKALSEYFGNPHERLKVIHVGGTNGKGSTSHTLAAVLQSQGYKVGLFTSPHLLDFRERIRVNGNMISEEDVCDFVERYRKNCQGLQPSFFELTTVMAFEYFRRQGVQIAVIEVGLGGRLDSTNIVNPILSIITNISKDHTALLGNTELEIASEKAGIIKPGIPVIIGEAGETVRHVFEQKAQSSGSPIIFAEDSPSFSRAIMSDDTITYLDTYFGNLQGELTGTCQVRNTATILTALRTLMAQCNIQITSHAVSNGLRNVTILTGLMGRWMKLRNHPLTICDTGHNIGGWKYLAPKLAQHSGPLHLVIGFVNDKDIDAILSIMPTHAKYYFTQASVPRALAAEELKAKAAPFGLYGESYPTVEEAYRTATNEAMKTDAVRNDLIFIGGSTFIVADALASISHQIN